MRKACKLRLLAECVKGAVLASIDKALAGNREVNFVCLTNVGLLSAIFEDNATDTMDFFLVWFSRTIEINCQ
jgi:hypothetical protein